MKSECKHEEFYFYPAPNENGWKCVCCQQKMPGEPPGFRPDLDRSHIYIKVSGLLHDLVDADFISISNGTEGEGLTEVIADQCRATGFYDQYSILQFILKSTTPSHAKYWKDISEGVLTGNDKRNRCHCGKLATTWTQRGHFCSEHDNWFSEWLDDGAGRGDSDDTQYRPAS